MAVKIADTLKALSNTFPVAECIDIDVNINGTTKRLQKAIDDGEIGGSDSTWNGTREEWEALSTEEKGKYEVICFTDDYDESGICGSDSTWKGTHEEWEALSTEEKGKYEVVYFTDDYDGSGICESDSTWKGTLEEWGALLPEEKGKYEVVYFTNDYDDSILIDDTNTSGKTTYSSSKIENSLSKKANTTDLTVHTSDTNIHVTTSDKTKWNKVDNKVDKTNIVDNLTSTDTDKPLSANQGKILKGEVGLKANSTDLTSHTSDTDIHVTTTDKAKWNKVDNKANVTDLTSHTSNTGVHITTAERTKWNEVDNKVNKTDIVDNLTSTDTNKPLSAKQGKALNDKIGLKANDNEVIKKTAITTTIDNSSTDTQVPSAKAIYNNVKNASGYTDTVVIDCNECVKVGYYFVDKKTTNNPTSEIYGILHVFGQKTDIESQTVQWIFQEFTSSSGKKYMRYSINPNSLTPTNWSTWQKICTASVADVGVTTINPTLPSTVTLGSSQRIIYSIKNGWANVSTVMQFSSPKLSWVVIATGLPKPDKTVNTSTVGETFVNANVAYRIKTDGTLEMKIDSEITQLNWWNINVSYPVAEQ